MFIDPVDSQSAAIHENNGERLAGGCHSFHQILFWLRQVDAGAIAAEEAGFAHRHLFTLKLARDAHNRDDDISVLRSRDRFRRRSIVRLCPDQFCMRLCRSCFHM